MCSPIEFMLNIYMKKRQRKTRDSKVDRYRVFGSIYIYIYTNTYTCMYIHNNTHMYIHTKRERFYMGGRGKGKDENDKSIPFCIVYLDCRLD